jgi:hypothetical protein
MTPKSEVRTLTLRLPEALYSGGSGAASRRKISMNTLICESLAAYLRDEEEQELFDAFTLAGEAEDVDVEFAFEAQADATR